MEDPVGRRIFPDRRKASLTVRTRQRMPFDRRHSLFNVARGIRVEASDRPASLVITRARRSAMYARAFPPSELVIPFLHSDTFAGRPNGVGDAGEIDAGGSCETDHACAAGQAGFGSSRSQNTNERCWKVGEDASECAIDAGRQNARTIRTIAATVSWYPCHPLGSPNLGDFSVQLVLSVSRW